MVKSLNAYKTIGEVVKIIGLKSKKGQSLPTHTIRFWETKFKQIRPKIFNGNRRYYDEKSIEIIKKVHFLLKNKGMTINGVKKCLYKEKFFELDVLDNRLINSKNIMLKSKLTKISKLIKEIKQLG